MSLYDPPSEILTIFNPYYYTTSGTVSTEYVDLVSNQIIGGTKTFSNEIQGSNGIDIATGSSYQINNASVLNSTTLGSSIVNSSLTTLGNINQNLNLTTGNEYRINSASILSSTTLGSTVINSSLQYLGSTIRQIINLQSGFEYRINNVQVLSNNQLGNGIVNSFLNRVGTTIAVSNTLTYTIATTSTNVTISWTGYNINLISDFYGKAMYKSQFTLPTGVSTFRFQIPVLYFGKATYYVSNSDTAGASVTHYASGNLLLGKGQTFSLSGSTVSTSVLTQLFKSSTINTISLTNSSVATTMTFTFVGSLSSNTTMYVMIWTDAYDIQN